MADEAQSQYTTLPQYTTPPNVIPSVGDADTSKDEKDEKVGKKTTITPSITVSESYQSNVFFGLTGPGVKQWDYVTSAFPQVRVEHRERLIEGSVQGGVTTQTYVNNPGLNYVAANGSLNLTLDGAVRQLVRGARLGVTEGFRFTPQPTAFLAPASAGEAPSDVFIRGMQATRANSFSNTATAAGSFPLSPTASLKASYTNSLMRFGAPLATPAFGGFFRTHIQRVNAGPQLQISARDTISLTYQYLQTVYSRTSGFTAGFETQGGLVGWTRALTPTLKANVAAGATVLSVSNTPLPIANASLEWKNVNNTTDVVVRYSRSVYPSFYGANLPLLSQMVSAAGTHRLSEMFSVRIQAYFALNQSTPSPLLTFESYGGQFTVDRTIMRNVTASVSYSYFNFNSKLSSSAFDFDRHMVMLSIRAEWE